MNFNVVLVRNLKWAIFSLFLFIFCLFKQTIQLIQHINVKNVISESCAEIWTHDLLIISLLSLLLLGQSSCYITW